MKNILWVLMLLIGCNGEYYVDKTPDPELNNYPLNMSWSDIDTDGDGIKENYITPIKNQPCDDCYIYAAVGLLEIQYQIDHKVQINLDLSEQNIHNCLRISCSATGNDGGILNYIRDYGLIQEYYAPTGMWGECNNCLPFLDGGIGTTTVEHVPFFKFDSWKAVVYPDMDVDTARKEIVKALQSGPITLYISGWHGLRKNGDTLYCSGWKVGGHFVVAVGYRYHGKVLIVKNSHGEGGLLKIALDEEDECGITIVGNQITPGSTYSTWGSGEKFCYSANDIDKDGIPDVYDNCPWSENPKQENFDNDMFGDACDECPQDRDFSTGFYCAP